VKNLFDQKKYYRQYYQNHKEQRKEYLRKWHKHNPQYYIEYRKKQRQKILELLGEKCVNCGFSDPRALQIDHVNGDGCKDEKRTFRHAYYVQVLKEIKEGSKKYQLLCANCNWIKKFENNEV